MVEDPGRAYWFGAVAGASAGAITATLIAAGFRPDQVGAETAAGLEALRQPTLLSGLLRVRDGLSYLDRDRLSDWIRDVLERQIRDLSGEPGGASVTFEELYRFTSIELHVVAVDLQRQRPVVFDHALTPRCEVAAAVVASAAIPVVFESMRLAIPGEETGMIVDGGVIANFPAFVFIDRSFRTWAGLPPDPAATPVVGFLLDEDRADGVRSDLYRDSSFGADGASQRRKFRPRRVEPSPRARLARRLAWPARLALWPAAQILLRWLPAALRWNGGGHRGAWPEPRNATFRSFVAWFDGVMTGTRPVGMLIGGFAAATLCIGYGAYHVAWLPLVNHVEGWIAGESSILGGAIGFAVLVAWSLVPVYAWMVITVAFLGGWVLHRTVQTTGYGLVKTFLQGPGAPVWVGSAPEDQVVRLPVPPGISTLGVTVGDEEVEAALEQAREATRTTLRGLEAPDGIPPIAEPAG